MSTTLRWNALAFFDGQTQFVGGLELLIVADDGVSPPTSKIFEGSDTGDAMTPFKVHIDTGIHQDKVNLSILYRRLHLIKIERNHFKLIAGNHLTEIDGGR